MTTFNIRHIVTHPRLVKILSFCLQKYLDSFLCSSPRLTFFEKLYLLQLNPHGDYWLQKIEKFFPEARQQTRPEKLRVILGLGRSGTTWVGKMLATSQSKLRYFEEPLYHIKPELCFTDTYDHTAIDYHSRSLESDRLLWAYQILTTPNSDWSSMGIQNSLKRDDPEFDVCLVKEVHALLATEQLITAFECPIILLIRNPLYIVDSIIHAQSLHAVYLDEESRKIPLDLIFLTRFFPHDTENIKNAYQQINRTTPQRKKIILRKILTAAVITEYLKQISNKSKNVLLIQYEDICLNASDEYCRIANFLKIKWDNENEKKLNETMNKNSDPSDPYSISRVTKKQINKELKVLTDDERKSAEKILHKCNLHYVYNNKDC